MNRRRRILSIAAIAAISLTSVAVVAGPAAAKTVNPTGTVTCSVGGNLGFNPPLTPGNGTPGFSNEIVSVNLMLSECGGISHPGGLVPTAAASVVTKSLKIKATKIGGTEYAGGCLTFFAGFFASSLKSSTTWNSGIMGSKTLLGGVSIYGTSSGEYGFTASGNATKSFAGPASLGAIFDPPSSNSMHNCFLNSGGPVASATFDTTTSWMTIGSMPGVPSAPTGVTATGGNHTASVTWTTPATDGGSAILGYHVTSSPGSLTCTAASNSCTVTGLTNGTSYTFTAVAFNATGTGAASAASAPLNPSPLSLAFVHGPSDTTIDQVIAPPVTVQVVDAFGGNVADSSATVTLTPSAGGINSGGSATTDSSGLATFGSVTIDQAAIGLRLTASSSGLSNSPASNSFNVTVPPPSVICSSASGTATSPANIPINLGGCILGATGGSGFVNVGSVTTTVNWANGSTTTFTGGDFSLGGYACPAGLSVAGLTATVSSSTGPVGSVPGEVVRIPLCQNLTTEMFTLAPGQLASF